MHIVCSSWRTREDEGGTPVYEEIEFEVIEGQGHIPALSKTNALLHSPFTWEDETEDVE